MSDSTIQKATNTQLAEITGELPSIEGVCFDADGISLQGVYGDELSLFRARNIWSETLESTFLLEKDRDFEFLVNRSYEQGRFALRCTFLTACGRYAFWRLTNNQAPEAQYEIETAHIPDSLARHDDFIAAPDLKPVKSTPLALQGLDAIERETKSFSQWLHEVIEKIGKTF